MIKISITRVEQKLQTLKYWWHVHKVYEDKTWQNYTEKQINLMW